MRIYTLPADTNFSAYDHNRALFGYHFIDYIANGYFSHQRVVNEIQHDKRDQGIFYTFVRNSWPFPTIEDRHAAMAYFGLSRDDA